MIDKCVIPELHVMEGFVIHLFFKGIVPRFGYENAMQWPKKLNLVSKSYHGEKFEGNACRKLLKESDMLRDPAVCGNDVLKIEPFIAVFKTMNKIVECCFSTSIVNNDLPKYIAELRVFYKALDMAQTLKIHIVLEHLVSGLKFLEGCGFGPWSEQAGETVHSEFEKYWEKYRINCPENSNYAEHIKLATVEFSSRHSA